MIWFHPHGSLDHRPRLCARPQPSLRAYGPASRTALAMPRQRWPGRTALPLWPLSTPLFFYFPLLHLSRSSSCSVSIHPASQFLTRHLNQVFANPVPCVRHTVKTLGIQQWTSLASGNLDARRRDRDRFLPLTSLLFFFPLWLLEFLPYFFPVRTVPHSLLHPGINTYPHRSVGCKEAPQPPLPCSALSADCVFHTPFCTSCFSHQNVTQ